MIRCWGLWSEFVSDWCVHSVQLVIQGALHKRPLISSSSTRLFPFGWMGSADIVRTGLSFGRISCPAVVASCLCLRDGVVECAGG